MAQITNITGEALSVPLLNRTVDPGETVDVADYLLTEYVWPDVTWRVETRWRVETPKAAKAKEQ